MFYGSIKKAWFISQDSSLEISCLGALHTDAGAQPVYHIFGHIHEEGLKRKAMLGGTTYLNVSYFDELRKRIGL